MAEFAVQQAAYNALSGLAHFTANSVGVFDVGPSADDGAGIFPYVAIGRAVLTEFDTDDTTGFDVLLRVHSYSDQSNMQEVKDIQTAMYDALHRQSFPVTGYDTILIRREDSDVMRASSGAFHGVCEYRVLLDRA